jgi:hypothetical protein
MEERFPPVDDRLAVAEPEPPPGSARAEPASIAPGSAEAYLELLASHVHEMEEYLYELTDHRDELLAEEEHLTARIRVLRRSVGRVAGGEDVELEPGSTHADPAVWSRLWERPPRAVADAVDPAGGRSAAATIDELRATSERGYVAALQADGRRRVTRWLLVSLAAIWISGTLLGAMVLSRPDAAPTPGGQVAEVGAPSLPTSTTVAASAEYVPATMPDVLGERLSDATAAITEAQLTVVDLRLVRGREGVVVASDPTAGEAIAAGTGVTLSIGGG